MAAKTDIQLTGQALVGSMDNGETVFMEVRTETMGILVLKTPAHAWAKLLAAFRTAGDVAAKVRAGIKSRDDPFAVVSAFRVTRAATSRATTGEVLIHASTHDGIPISLALSADQAATLSEALAVEIQHAPKQPRGH